MLSQRIMTLFVLMAVGPPAILGLVMFFMVQAELADSSEVARGDLEGALVRQTFRRNEVLARQVALQLDDRLRAWQRRAEAAAKLPAVAALEPAAATAAMAALEQGSAVVVALAIYGTDGRAAMVDRAPADGVAIEAAELAAALAGEAVLGELRGSAANGQPVVTIAEPLRGEQGAVTGCLAVEVAVAPLTDLVAQSAPGIPGGWLCVTTSDGRLVAHSGRPPPADPREPAAEAGLARVGELPAGSHRAAQELVSWQALTRTSWRVLAVVPAEAALRPVQATTAELQAAFGKLLLAVRQHSLAIVLVFLVLAALTARVVARDIVGPLQQVVEGITHVKRGALDTRVAVQRDDELGRLVAAFNELADELQASRQELLHTRDRSEHIMKTVTDSMLVLDADGRITGCNPTALETLGYASDELVGKAAGDLFEEKFRQQVREQLASCDEMSPQETVILTSYGVRLPVLVATSLLRDPRQTVVGAVLVARDITDQLQVEEDRRRLASIVQGSTDLIATLSTEGHMLFLNQAGRAMLGVRQVTQLLGKGLADFCGADERSRLREVWLPQTLNEGRAEGELTFCPLGGKPPLPVHVTFSLIADPDSGQPALIAAIGRDITLRREALQQLQRYAAELEASNRELEQFAFITSHDLREPLRKLHNLSQLLNRRYADKLDPKGVRILDFIGDSALRMLALIKDLLAYSRVGSQTQPMVRVDCRELVKTVLGDLSMSIREERAEIQVDELPTVTADPDQIAMVFRNLLANALKFHGAEPPRIQVGARRGDNEWAFFVRDNGIGIAPEHHEKIFVIFQRLHEASRYEGTGIGLAICKKIVDRHGGRLGVDSRLGEGATFTFTIPDWKPLTGEVSHES